MAENNMVMPDLSNPNIVIKMIEKIDLGFLGKLLRRDDLDPLDKRFLKKLGKQLTNVNENTVYYTLQEDCRAEGLGREVEGD
jgi:ribosomal 50S subunit-associated protein YjgA (DUF615 family)